MEKLVRALDKVDPGNIHEDARPEVTEYVGAEKQRARAWKLGKEYERNGCTFPSIQSH